VLDHEEHQVGPLKLAIGAKHMIQQLEVPDKGTCRWLAAGEYGAGDDAEGAPNGWMRDVQELKIHVAH